MPKARSTRRGCPPRSPGEAIKARLDAARVRLEKQARTVVKPAASAAACPSRVRTTRHQPASPAKTQADNLNPKA